jgi:4-amino-4-deoxy-L-arabinose transferase-like glycosyltransferase
MTGLAVRVGHDMQQRAPIGWRDDTLALGFGLLALGLHAVFAARYDLFRDELYFIVCGRHLAFGYADQPPVVPLLAAGLYALGHTVWLVRLPATLAAGALAWLAVRLARLLGGGAAAGAGAALCVTIAPMLMGLGAILNTTVFDPLAWTAIAGLLAYTLKTRDRRALWLCGIIAGLDLETKYSLVFWGAGLGAGLILTPERRLLAFKDLWIGAAIAAAIAAPSLVWQALHGFPFLELAAAAREKNADTPPAAFILNQILVMNPLLAPVWLSGVAAPFVIEGLRPARFLAIGFIVCAALVIATHGKDYYLAAAYPVMFITGAVAIAHWTRAAAARVGLTGWATAAVAFSAWISPMALPVLPIPALKTYIQTFPLKPQPQEKSFKGTLLPQVFADQLGWRDFAGEVGAAFARIPAAERARTAVKVDNYGEAAALDVYGGPWALPPALSGHNQYYLWGLRGQRPVNLLVVQNHPERLAPFCGQATVLGATSSPDAMAYENGKAIAYCRGLKVDPRALWPGLKNYS